MGQDIAREKTRDRTMVRSTRRCWEGKRGSCTQHKQRNSPLQPWPNLLCRAIIHPLLKLTPFLHLSLDAMKFAELGRMKKVILMFMLQNNLAGTTWRLLVTS